MEKKSYHKLLKFGIILIVISPLLFQVFKLKNFTPLNGAQISKSAFFLDSCKNKISWWNGNFQKFTDLEIQEHLHVKSPLVRLRNQYEYALYSKINAKDIYEYQGDLFRFYTKDYNEGVNFNGETILTEKIQKLREIEKVLGPNIPILTIIAPSKTYLNAEKLPKVNTLQMEKSNYKFIKKLLLKQKLNVIDFNTHFLQLKHKSAFPLIGSRGIHWTQYGASVAFDSIISKIEFLKNQKYDHPKVQVENSYAYNYDDQDLSEIMNLFFPKQDKNTRNIVIKKSSGKNKIKALIISDSFFDVVSKTNLRQAIFTDNSIYSYYFSGIANEQNKSNYLDKSKLLDLAKEMDCILILTDIVNMENFGFGFIEKMHEQIKLKVSR